MPKETTVCINLQPELLCWLECVAYRNKMRPKFTQQCLNDDNIFAKSNENNPTQFLLIQKTNFLYLQQ